MVAGKAATTEEKFHFLIGCIKLSHNGRVDFTKLAAEHKLTRGAAKTRFYTIMNAHGVKFGGGSILEKRPKGEPEPKQERPSTPVKKEQEDDPVMTPPLSTTAGSVESTPKSSRSPKTPNSSSPGRRVKRNRPWDSDDDFSGDEITIAPRTGLRKRQKKSIYAEEWDVSNENEDDEWALSL